MTETESSPIAIGAQGRPLNDQNCVTLRGRVSAEPVSRELPSGDQIVSVRVVLARERTAMTRGSRQPSDWVECVAWASRARRSVASWRPGDTVEIEGALRRRYYRAGGVPTTRVEVEVLKARSLRRVGA
ncbi:MAG TPA: single-stranded DNA-binding protein [Nocardioidaceae bacterium]|nr:single-stranded DNA-binding protein [Nocardioidaceae bacterium]